MESEMVATTLDSKEQLQRRALHDDFGIGNVGIRVTEFNLGDCCFSNCRIIGRRCNAGKSRLPSSLSL